MAKYKTMVGADVEPAIAADKMDALCNTYFEDGWIPFGQPGFFPPKFEGGVCVFAQAMVKPDRMEIHMHSSGDDDDDTPGHKASGPYLN